jgi:hypothetical protein
MLKQFLKDHTPSFFASLQWIQKKFIALYGRVSQRGVIEYWYKALYHRPINLEVPKDFDEKINWMKLHADTSLWTYCSDKFLVREYVKEHGLEHTLNELYGVYDNAKEIPFDTLPDSFVVKTTQGGGGKNVLLVKDKSTLDRKKTIRKLNRWLKQRPQYLYGEYHYAGIKPRLVVEKYLEEEESKMYLTDFKIFCFSGVPYSVFLCTDRDSTCNVKYSIYDLNWNNLPEKVKEKKRSYVTPERPRSFNQILEYSRILSKGIPFVRVDWYEIDGAPIFGEMTFTHAGGFSAFFTHDYLLELGNKLDVSAVEKAR